MTARQAGTAAELYRRLGWPVEREPGDAADAGRADCLLPGSEHDTGSRTATVRMKGECWSCESCRNFGDTQDLIAFREMLSPSEGGRSRRESEER